MSALREQQHALLQALWQPTHPEAIAALEASAQVTPGGAVWQRGLVAYRSNGLELAQRALASAYPVVAQLLGDDNFNPLARLFWRQQPPMRGDLAQWGEPLADWLAQLPGLASEEPYLPDVARVEWALHRAAMAADARPDRASLALLADHDPAELTLVLSPGAWAHASAYPVVSVVQAHASGEPALEEAGRRLRDGLAETALVWRDGLRPRLREALPGEASFIHALQENSSLLDSLAAAPGFDFNAWLAPALQGGLLTGAQPL